MYTIQRIEKKATYNMNFDDADIRNVYYVINELIQKEAQKSKEPLIVASAAVVSAIQIYKDHLNPEELHTMLDDILASANLDLPPNKKSIH